MIAMRISSDYFSKLKISNPQLKTISWFTRNRWFGDSDFVKVHPACVVGKTSAGGRIAVFAHYMRNYMWFFLNTPHRLQLIKVLTYLSNENMPWVNCKSDLWFLFGKTADPKRFIAAVFNLNPDTIEKLDLYLPCCKPVKIRLLDDTGRFRDVTFESVGGENNRVSIDIKIPTIKPFIFEIITG